MATKNTETIRELTTSEIARQVQPLIARRQEIVAGRAEDYKSRQRNAAAPIYDDDERASREHARSLLNGEAPETLSLPPELAKDRILMREMRGIDIALKILASKDLVARTVEAVRWAEEHDGEWRTLCRDIVLTAVRLDALEDRARRLLEQCIDVSSIRLPMANIIGGRAISEIPISDLTERAMAAGVATSTEVKKARS
jgi:hypothetical protein